MPDFPLVQDLRSVFLLDTRHGRLQGTVGSYLLPGEGGTFALIESGPASTLPTLLAGIREAGFEPEDLSDVLVTHIHLDHAGAAGTLARTYGATVWVHASGAPHLVDPSRLLSSARRVYGDEMEALWGSVEGVPEAQVRARSDGDTFELFGHSVRVLATPGHASSHVSYLLDGKTMFTGDAAAIKLPGSGVVRPATAPPEIDLEAWDQSLDAMRQAAPDRLLLTHFGEVKDVAAHLEKVRERTHAWAEEVLAGLQAGEDDAALVARISRISEAELEADGALPEARVRHRTTSNDEMSAAGLKRYWQKRHPERITR